MEKSQNILEDIRDIFAILHDGCTTTWTGDKNLLELKVECKYLAERIDPSFDSFYIELGQIDKLELHPWLAIGLPETVFIEIETIFKAELEMLSATIENNHVVVSCNQHDTAFNYNGGNLSLNCKTIRIFDDAKRLMTIDDLDNVCKAYWKDFSKKVEESIKGKKPED